MKEAELLQLIKSDTKNAKKEIDREAVREHNLARMEAVGIDKSLINSMENRGQKEPINEEVMKEHIDKSLDNLIQKQSLFRQEDLSKMVLKYGLEYGYTEKDYLPFITKNSEIIQLDKNIYSTQKMIDAEKNIIKSIHNSRDTFDNFAEYESDKVRLFLEKNYPTMTDEQVKMVRFILGNKDQFVAIQGDAGTGKTFAARAVKEYLETYHDTQEIIGLSFTGKATQGLESSTGIKSNTVHSFLAKEAKLEGEIEPKNRLIIVDEAGMVGSLQMNELIENAKRNGDRIVFMGDTKQFKSISAGNIFNDMQKWGAKTVRLSQAIRQESDLTKEAVTSLKEQMVKKSLSIIEEKGTFKESSRDESVHEIASNYANLKTKKQNDTLIITSTNKDKEAINLAIRFKLGKGGAEYKVLSNANLDGIAAHYAQGYEVGQKIAITGTIEGFSNKENLIVTGIKDEKTIIVKSGGKKSQEKQINVYEHSDKLQVFRESKKPFAKGEVIIFTKNTVIDRGTRTSVKNGERTRIKSINKHGDVVTAEGKKFNINKMPYVDHGYAITDVKSQGTTVKNVVVMAQSDMANFNSFYTQITRAKKNITLYTDNKEQLAANVQKTDNLKTTLDYTIKKKEPQLEKDSKQEISQTKEKRTFKDITTDKYVANPMDIKKSPENTLKKVGVHQSNLDSEMKIDIYRNSIGKLDGMDKEKSTTPHEKYRGIEVARKQQKEQPNENRGRDTKATKEALQQSREHRREIGESGRGQAGRNQERTSPNQGQHDRDRQRDDSRTGVFTKVKGKFASFLRREEKQEARSERPIVQAKKEVPSKNRLGRDTTVARSKTLNKMKGNNHVRPTEKQFSTNRTTQRELREPFTRRRRVQSNTTASRRESILRDRTSVYRLSHEPLVRVKPSPKVLLQGNVPYRMGRGESTRDGVRREGDVNHGITRSQTPREITQKELYEKVKAFKGSTKAKPVYTPDKSKSVEERVRDFIKHRDKHIKKEKSREMGIER